jgi:hypothetical protein
MIIRSLDEQRRIVAYLDSVQARLASLRQLQSATREELSALTSSPSLASGMPSILDKAFKDERFDKIRSFNRRSFCAFRVKYSHTPRRLLCLY